MIINFFWYKYKKIFDKAKNTPYNEFRNKNVDEKSSVAKTYPERLSVVRLV